MNTSDQTILKDPSVMHSQYVLTCSVQVESGWELLDPPCMHNLLFQLI